MIYIIGGVAGSGKTTVGTLLASRLGVPFYDADDFHVPENIEKMASGIPLSDKDRISWLRKISLNMVRWDQEGGCVLACSALKEFYRNILTPIPTHHVQWIILEGDRNLILRRIRERKGHFFDERILGSQFDIFEKPKYGWFYNVANPVDAIVDEILVRINQM